jgi:ADP-L-glycero-D-manno-heptose 6-epimerase
MIIVTGAAGFIGSCLISRLNADHFNSIIAVDDFSDLSKNKNLEGKKIKEKIDREKFFEWIDANYEHVEFIFHIGARTDTTEFDKKILDHLNVDYSKKIWKKCIDYQIPLVYASSAATYGLGELGYMDDEKLIPQLHPLNPYGESKNEFDKWVLQQDEVPFFWVGLKFFNVYGPNEYHKERMASVIFHSYNQIVEKGKVKLFRSHHPDFKDGEQKRDFVYVKDVIAVCYWFMESVSRESPVVSEEQAHAGSQLTIHHSPLTSGIYNLGTGKARTFNDLVKSTFAGLDLKPEIEYIDMPEDIRDKYQYFTEASMDKLRAAGYTTPFYSLEKGVDDYVRNYLSQNLFY